MSAATTERPRRSAHPACRVALIATAVVQLATAALLAWEQTWAEPRASYGPQAAFVAGSVGTEFIPLPVLEVLPEIAPESFPAPTINAAGTLEGGWIAKYGFVARRAVDEPTFPATGPELSALLKADEALARLPVGFTLTKVRPFTPDPSPVRFVGLACAGCHSARLPDDGPGGKIVLGAGNPTLDLIRFFEAFRGALLDKVPKAGVPDARVSITEKADLDPKDMQYSLTLGSVVEARAKKSLPALGLAERIMILAWLSQTQSLLEANTKRDDLPATPGQLLRPEFNPVGPGRTEPFVTLDHEVLGLPAKDNRGYSKIPAVFLEGTRRWAQFDGSVASPKTRSGLAAMTAGGSVDNLGGLGVGHHVIRAAEYTVCELVGPRWADLFGKPPGGPPAAGPADPSDAEAALLDEPQRRGRIAYRQHCASCHGRPDQARPTRWLGQKDNDFGCKDDQTRPNTVDAYFGKIFPTIDPFDPKNTPPIPDWMPMPDRPTWDRNRTDPERVVFRDGSILPYKLFTYFDREHPIKSTGEYYPLDHPLAVPRPEIRNSGGYVNAPLDSLFLRAPYLHNGSIPNLRQLLNLDPRPATFLRGHNTYDPAAAGIDFPAPTPGLVPTADDTPFWVFDTSQRGNGNYGHHYPWAFDDPKKDAKLLEDLLAYLKTL